MAAGVGIAFAGSTHGAWVADIPVFAIGVAVAPKLTRRS